MRGVGRCSSASFHTTDLTASHYPLLKSTILDSGSTIDITNDRQRLRKYQQADRGDFVWAGVCRVPIHGYGELKVNITTPSGQRAFDFPNTAYCPTFVCNIISHRKLRQRGYWWDTREDPTYIRRNKDYSILAILQDIHEQYVIDYVPLYEESPNLATAFHTIQSSRTPVAKRKPRPALAEIWHQRLGHPNPEALARLVNRAIGVSIKGPTTVECDQCGIAKAKRIVSRAPRHTGCKPGERIAVDFHDFEEGYDGSKSLALFTDRSTGMMWDYYLSDRSAKAIITCFKHLIKLFEVQYEVRLKIVEADNEINTQKPRVREYLEEKGIQLEPSAPYTQAQNGGAERSGGVIKEKIRAMAGRLPNKLWPEICRAAVYLSNRTPRYALDWRSPYEKFFDAKPIIHHLRVYGCKAFALSTATLKKTNRLKRLEPRAWIGYLVGYASTNQYRVWLPSASKVIITRDAHFNEEAVFDGNLETLNNDIKNMSLDYLAEVLNNRVGEAESQVHPVAHYDTIEELDQQVIDEEHTTDNVDPIPLCQNENTTAVLEPMLTPPETPEHTPAALVTVACRFAPRSNQNQGARPQQWEFSFHSALQPNALYNVDEAELDRSEVQRNLFRKPSSQATSRKTLSREEVKQRIENNLPIYETELEPPPRFHNHVMEHPMRDQFLEAERQHLQSHEDMGSWVEVPKDKLDANTQVIDCMWVYVYKFHQGRYKKCKARLVARGDQQIRRDDIDTYAATLAIRSLRIFLAISARFDLELYQYDAVNAYVHTTLDEQVYMKMPPGYRRKGVVYRLGKALYGLRKSGRLWQKDLKSTLRELEFLEIPHEPCCMINGKIIIFFFVDDMVFALPRSERGKLAQVVIQLKQRYHLTGGGELKWFLGMEVIRERQTRQIWLTQAAFVDKIARLAETNPYCQSPMGTTEIMPFEGKASTPETRKYQRKIGSLLYAAITTRPDVAFATSRLARYMTNPGPEHQRAADRAISYLVRSRSLALQFNSLDTLQVACDSSFADNTLDRKSSQGYVMKLFGGTIDWKASKQATVTTSSTEAELLSLSQAARESMFVMRLITELTVKLDSDRITIQCDNQQTIRLIHTELAKLNTRLRHVDIHNHWLRQEAAEERIQVAYVKTKENVADGLTKALQQQTFLNFVRLVGLVDISHRLQNEMDPLNIESMFGELLTTYDP